MNPLRSRVNDTMIVNAILQDTSELGRSNDELLFYFIVNVKAYKILQTRA